MKQKSKSIAHALLFRQMYSNNSAVIEALNEREIMIATHLDLNNLLPAITPKTDLELAIEQRERRAAARRPLDQENDGPPIARARLSFE